MEADSSNQHLVKRTNSESEDECDNGLRSSGEMALEKLASQDSKNAPLVRLDGASELLKQMRLMERERESRELEKEVRRKTEEVLQRERKKLEEEIRAEREEARWRKESEEKSAFERERRVAEWEERVIGEVMRREEDLRRREKEFMSRWELERLMAQKRALRFEKDVMTTEHEIRVLSIQMAVTEQQRRKQNVKDSILILVTFCTFVILVIFMSYWDKTPLNSDL